MDKMQKIQKESWENFAQNKIKASIIFLGFSFIEFKTESKHAFETKTNKKKKEKYECKEEVGV